MYTIYSKPTCSYCNRAKRLLTELNLPFTEIEVDVGQPKEQGKQYCTVEQLKERVPSAKTVPQIFEGDVLIGGYTELAAKLG
jgi:glutaredoxin 3